LTVTDNIVLLSHAKKLINGDEKMNKEAYDVFCSELESAKCDFYEDWTQAREDTIWC